MKKSEIFFSTILVPLDYILIVVAGMSAYWLRYSRFYEENIREVVFSLSVTEYFKYVLGLAFVWIVIYALAGLFSMRPNKKIFDEFNKIFFASSTAALFVIVIFFFSRELFASRFIVLAAWGLVMLYTFVVHLIVRGIQKQMYIKGIGVHKVILVGNDVMAKSLSDEFERNVKLGYKVVARLADAGIESMNKIENMALEDEVDEIVQTDPSFSRYDVLKLLDISNEYHLDFKYTADMLGARKSNVDIKTIQGIPVLEIKKTPLDGWGRVVKRVFDIIGSFLSLVVFSPIFLVTALAIVIDSKGPIIYKDERVGVKEKKFNLYKFRSMVVGADKMKKDLEINNQRSDGPLFKIENDPRITRVGKFIRRTSIDEFPNFWNVFIGNMSLVGPRPHEPHEVARYDKHHKKLLNIKPGITGMAQISGRSTLDFESEAKLDTLYIETWSFWQDIVILLKTPIVVIFSRTAS